MASNTTVYIIAAIVILHFLIGIGFILYKISTAKPKENTPLDVDLRDNTKEQNLF